MNRKTIKYITIDGFPFCLVETKIGKRLDVDSEDPEIPHFVELSGAISYVSPMCNGHHEEAWRAFTSGDGIYTQGFTFAPVKTEFELSPKWEKREATR